MRIPGWIRRRKRPTETRSPEPSARSFRTAGDAARDARDWPAAIEAYRRLLELEPENTAIAVQLGHALKEAGRLEEAVAAYQTASNAASADAAFHLGVALSAMGEDDLAHDSYALTLRRDPTHKGARSGLIEASRRDLIPEVARGPMAAQRVFGRLEAQVARLTATLAEIESVSTFATQDYDAFRRAFPIPPPSSAAEGLTILVQVDGQGANPAQVRRTLTSLIDQSHDAWLADVWIDDSMARHPVISLANADGRARLCQGDAAERAETAADAVLFLRAGAILEPFALAWLSLSLQRTGARAVVFDHERYEPDWRDGPIRFQPMLKGMFNRLDLDGPIWSSEAVVFRWAEMSASLGSPAPDGLRRVADRLRAFPENVAHLPLPLVALSQHELTAEISAPPPLTNAMKTAKIVVIVPTLDQPDLLKGLIESLYAHASYPDRVEVRVVDNAPDSSANLPDHLAGLGSVDVLRADEPFNWSRLNNRAAAGSDASLIVFANDDMQMLTVGWDARVRDWLNQPDVGAVGARLLYPDRTLQHAGIVLGVKGRPVHEGRYADAADAGPMGRWRSSRSVAAVTGAFLACRREVFEQVGGFDERLAVAYNDIDFCLKVREASLKVVYAADIALIHHESKTRGTDQTEDRIDWDDAELEDLHDRWGDALSFDPSYNPHWATGPNRVFDGFRPLRRSEILAHLDQSIAPFPAKTTRDAPT